MVIKKYISEKNKEESKDSRLSAYKTQAKNYLKVNQNRKKITRNILKSGLASVLPLAAASLTPFVSVAQPCDPSGGSSTAGCAAGDFTVDMDGGGSEIVFIGGSSGLYMRSVNGFTVTAGASVVAPYHYATGYAAAASISSATGFTSGGNPFGGVACAQNTTASWVLETSYAGGAGDWFDAGGATISRVVGVSVDGNVGFIEVTWNNAISVATIGEYGLAETGITTIDAGDCSTLLPVELMYFTGKQENNNYLLSWQRATTVKDFAPNPVSEDFADLKIISPQRQKAQVLVYDAVGKKVFEKSTTLINGLHTIRIDLTQASSGTHFVNVVLENGESHFKKLVVTK